MTFHTLCTKQLKICWIQYWPDCFPYRKLTANYSQYYNLIVSSSIDRHIYKKCNCFKQVNTMQCIDITPLDTKWISSWSKYWFLLLKRLNIQLNSVTVRMLSDNVFVLPSRGFKPTSILHCSTNLFRIMTNHLISPFDQIHVH